MAILHDTVEYGVKLVQQRHVYILMIQCGITGRPLLETHF